MMAGSAVGVVWPSFARRTPGHAPNTTLEEEVSEEWRIDGARGEWGQTLVSIT